MLDLICFYLILALIAWVAVESFIQREVERRLKNCGLDRSMSHDELQDAIDHTYGKESHMEVLAPDTRQFHN